MRTSSDRGVFPALCGVQYETGPEACKTWRMAQGLALLQGVNARGVELKLVIE
jgi:hypothetical protein